MTIHPSGPQSPATRRVSRTAHLSPFIFVCTVSSLAFAAGMGAAASPKPKVTFSAPASHPALTAEDITVQKRYQPTTFAVSVAAGTAPLKGATTVTLVRGGKTIATIATKPFPTLKPGGTRKFTISAVVPEKVPGGPAFYRVCVQRSCGSTKVLLIRYPYAYTGTIDMTVTSSRLGDSQHWVGTLQAIRNTPGRTQPLISGSTYTLTTTALTVAGTLVRGDRGCSINPFPLENLPGILNVGSLSVLDSRAGDFPSSAQDDIQLLGNTTRFGVGGELTTVNPLPVTTPMPGCTTGPSPTVTLRLSAQNLTTTRAPTPDLLELNLNEVVGEGPRQTVVKLMAKW